MGRKPNTRQRILGPYACGGGRWRVVAVGANGARVDSTFDSRREAEREAAAARAAIGTGPATVGEALEEYERHLTEKGNKPGSVKATPARMRTFLADVLDAAPGDITPRQAEGIYRATVERVRLVGKDQREVPISTDTHRNYLAECRTFFAWMAKRGWIESSPFRDVVGVGRRRHGKAQLRVDELRTLSQMAEFRAHRGDDGALAALLAIWLGMRASEITGLRCRDIDNGAALLWIAESKTAAGRRRLEVPEALRPYLAARAANRGGEEYLLPAEGGGAHWRDWVRQNVSRLAEAAGVPTITAHGLRGSLASLAASAGTLGHLAAAHLGHESYTTTQESYISPGVEAEEQRQRGRKLLRGD